MMQDVKLWVAPSGENVFYYGSGIPGKEYSSLTCLQPMYLLDFKAAHKSAWSPTMCLGFQARHAYEYGKTSAAYARILYHPGDNKVRLHSPKPGTPINYMPYIYPVELDYAD